MNRRGFLGAMLTACAAPAIVRASSLMAGSGIIVNPREILVPSSALILPRGVSGTGRRVFSCLAGSLAFYETEAAGFVELDRQGDVVRFALPDRTILH